MNPSSGPSAAAAALFGVPVPSAPPARLTTAEPSPSRVPTFAELLTGLARDSRPASSLVRTPAGAAIIALDPADLTPPLKTASTVPTGWRPAAHPAPASGRRFPGQNKPRPGHVPPSATAPLTPTDPETKVAKDDASLLPAPTLAGRRSGEAHLNGPGVPVAPEPAARPDPLLLSTVAPPPTPGGASSPPQLDQGLAGTPPGQLVLNRGDAVDRKPAAETAPAGKENAGLAAVAPKPGPTASAQPSTDPSTGTGQSTLPPDSVVPLVGRGSRRVVVPDPDLARVPQEASPLEPEASSEGADSAVRRGDSPPPSVDHGSAGASPSPGIAPAIPIVSASTTPAPLEAAPSLPEESKAPAGWRIPSLVAGPPSQEARKEIQSPPVPDASVVASAPAVETKNSSTRRELAPAGSAAVSTDTAPTPASFSFHPATVAGPAAVVSDLSPADLKSESASPVGPKADHPESRRTEERPAEAQAPRAAGEAGNDPGRGGFNPRSGDGTDTANQPPEMRNDEHQDETTRRTGQNLPGAKTEPVGMARSAAGVVAGSAPAVVPPFVPPEPSFGPLPPATGAGNPAVSAPAPLPGESADRFLHLVMQEAAVVRQWKPDVLSVVLKPDAQTEITLNLTLRDGEVRAQAASATGNTAAWHAGWAELQQSLARQGIKLAPLQGTPPISSISENQARSGSPRSGDSSSGQSPNQGREKGEAFDFSGRVFSSKTPVRPAPRSRPGPGRLLENWA